MSDYRIEKVRRRVDVTLASGVHLHGDIFLQAFARFRAGPEEPLDVLNDAAPFMALVLESEEVLLVHKSQIAMVGTSLPDTDDPAETGVIGMHVDITLITGEAHSGSVFPELRADRPRLVDFLNNTPLRFLPLFSAEQLLLISMEHIAFARPAA